MRKYTIEEKNFLCTNSPRIKELSVNVKPCTFEMCDGFSPDSDMCFMTEEGREAYENEKECEGFDVTISFRDNGPDFEQHDVFVTDFIQFMDDANSENYVFEVLPKLIIPAVSDTTDTKYHMYLITGACAEESLNTENTKRKSFPIIYFSGLTFGNQFASESFNLTAKLHGYDEESGERWTENGDIEKENIRFDLMPDED